MGWKTQGYYKDLSDASLSWIWQVEGNSDKPNTNIEKYHLKKVNLGNAKDQIQIKYGTSSLMYFRGYIIGDQLDLAISQLSKFEGFKVYQNKYGDKSATFLIHQLDFMQAENLFIFYQKRKWTKDEWTDLIDDLYWILPDQNKELVLEKLQSLPLSLG